MIRYTRYVEPDARQPRAPSKAQSVTAPTAETPQGRVMPELNATLPASPVETQRQPTARLLPEAEPLELTAPDNKPARSSNRKTKQATRKAKAGLVVDRGEDAVPLLPGLEG